jgi:hypothetical protein
MRNLIYIVLALTLGALTSFGQGMITGRVVDETDKAGIEFSTVTLFNATDSSLVSGTVTDSTGMFALENVAGGTYYVKLSFIGYKAIFTETMTIDPQNPVIDLGEVALNPSSELGTVDITTSQSVFETKIDKKVFNADQNLTSKGGNGLDLLRQIPTITVDENDNILLRGDANVTILIDGRPSSMPANLLLRQIPASAIEKVEIITNPSAKYDPEGVSGIINIVMKKSKLNGFNGSINATFDYGKFAHANSTLSLNYRNEKINLYTNYSYYYDRTWFGGSLDRDVMLADSSWDRLRSVMITANAKTPIIQAVLGSIILPMIKIQFTYRLIWITEPILEIV